MAVGIFDSGLGGLTVLDAVQQRLPDMDFVYLADSANAPYGVRTADDIYDKTVAATQRLFDAGCDLVVLACNTASAAALRRMQEGWVPADKRVLGVFVPLIEAMTERQWGDNSPPREVETKHVALFATPATVASRAFQRELAFRAIGVDVEAQACGGVVDAIEDGDFILAEAMVRSHVDALKRKMPAPEAAILGCTHYPLMLETFQDALGADVKVLSSTCIYIDAYTDILRYRYIHTDASTDIHLRINIMTYNIAILGASGYTGAELIRLIAGHSSMHISGLGGNSKAGQSMASVFPHLRHLDLPDLVRIDDIDFNNIDLCFCALPHKTSQEVISKLPSTLKIVDLSADFRLTDPAEYEAWYGNPHSALDQQAEAVYGLTEFYRDDIAAARLVAGYRRDASASGRV